MRIKKHTQGTAWESLGAMRPHMTEKVMKTHPQLQTKKTPFCLYVTISAPGHEESIDKKLSFLFPQKKVPQTKQKSMEDYESHPRLHRTTFQIAF